MKYQGVEYRACDDSLCLSEFKYIAKDKDGSLYAYSSEPYLLCIEEWECDGRHVLLEEVPPEDQWKYSLEEIK